MIKSRHYTTIIKPEEGYYLTEANPDTDIRKRSISTAIALGKNDSAENYIEIDEAQAEEYRKQKEEAIKADQEKLREENK